MSDSGLEMLNQSNAIPSKNEPDLGTKLIGGAQTAADVAAAHPWLASGAALAGSKLVSNVPVVETALNAVGNKLIPGYGFAKNVAQGVNNAANAWANTSTRNTMMETYQGLQHTASQYVKSGQQVPQGLVDILKDIEGKLVAQKATGSVAPTAPTASNAGQMAAQTAGQAAESNNWMARAMNTAKQAAPTLQRYAGQAMEAMAPVARVAAPAMNFVSRMNPYIGAAQGLTYSAPTGPAVPQSGPLRGSEINPQTGRAWTAPELQAYQQQYPQ
jgi:hypothetical protein